MSASRASRPGAPGSAAAQVTGVRSSPASVKATSGRLIASRRTTSRIASPSVRSLLRNLSRAGVAKKRSRTSTRVPSPSAAGLTCDFVAAVDRDRPGVRLARVPRGDREPRDRADRRQRLAAEAERADVEQVVVGELRGGVALDREREIVARHAGAVVGDADQPAAAAVGHDLDRASRRRRARSRPAP